MASALFTLADTQEARTEISLLLQIEPSQLAVVAHNGFLVVEFPNLLEDKALHVLSSAVANHGFQVAINNTPVKPVKEAIIPTKPKQPQPQGPQGSGGSERGSK